MSLLTLVQDAAEQLSLNIPTTIVGNTSPTTRHLLRLAQREGESLAKRHTWEKLTTEHSFSTVAAEIQTSSIPSDFLKIIPETMFNRTTNRYVVGPLSGSEWQEIKSSTVALVNPAYRIRGGTIIMTPTPTASQSVYYEYISKNFCESSGGTGQSEWAADDDVGVLDEALLTLGIVWRFKQAKGMDFVGDQQMYERDVLDAVLNDGARIRLSTDPVGRDRVPNPPFMPDTIPT